VAAGGHSWCMPPRIYGWCCMFMLRNATCTCSCMVIIQMMLVFICIAVLEAAASLTIMPPSLTDASSASKKHKSNTFGSLAAHTGCPKSQLGNALNILNEQGFLHDLLDKSRGDGDLGKRSVRRQIQHGAEAHAKENTPYGPPLQHIHIPSLDARDLALIPQ
jgi:hypothetical protein